MKKQAALQPKEELIKWRLTALQPCHNLTVTKWISERYLSRTLKT